MSSKAAEDAARAGWDIYRQSGYKLELDQLNRRLKAIGHQPISNRMFDHYRRLHRRGYRHYVSINRLDTLALADPLYYQSVRSRYSYYPTDSPVRLTIAAQQTYEAVGTATALSNVGVEVEIADPGQAAAIASASLRPSTPITVDFLDPPATFHGRLNSTETLAENVVVNIDFVRLTPIQEITEQDSLPATDYRLMVDTEPKGDWLLDEVARELFLTLQVIEAARGMANEVVRSFGVESEVVAAPVSIANLQMSSPLVIELGMFGGIASLVLTVLKGRDWWHGGTIKKRQGQLLEAEADFKRSETERNRAETKQLTRENDSGAATSSEVQPTESAQPEPVKNLLLTLMSDVREALPPGTTVSVGATLNVERVDGLLTDEMIPALEALGDQGVVDLRFEVIHRRGDAA